MSAQYHALVVPGVIVQFICSIVIVTNIIIIIPMIYWSNFTPKKKLGLRI